MAEKEEQLLDVLFGDHKDPKQLEKIIAAAKEEEGWGTSYKRDQFKTYEGYCEWQKQRRLARAAFLTKEADEWEKRKVNDDSSPEGKKMARMERLKKQLMELEAELGIKK